MAPITIANGESGSSVRTKLNNTGLERYLPFFGDKSVLWSRPGLDISGDGATHFNAWLNQDGDSSIVGVGNNLWNNSAGGVAEGLAASPGTEYVPGDTVTLTGDTVLTINRTQVVSAAISVAGTGGTPGPAILIGTTGSSDVNFLLQVTIGAGGGIDSIERIQWPGLYSTNPTDLANEHVAEATGGHTLAGAKVSIEMGAALANVTTPGSITSNPVAQTGTSGAGSGATWMLYFGGRSAIATDNAGGGPLVIEADVAGLETANLYNGKSISGLLKDAPTAPWTVTVGLAAPSMFQLTLYPIIVKNSVSNSAFALAWWQQTDSGGDTASGPSLFTNTWADITSNDALLGNSTDTLLNMSPLMAQSYFQWFRYQNDGTNLIISISYENIRYQEILRFPLSRLGFTIDQLGFGIQRGANYDQSGNQAVVLWNWVES